MSYDIVCFDFDSTLSSIEGIDELAHHAGLGHEIDQLTQQAMEGIVALESVYEKRLAMIKPNQAMIAWLAEQYIANKVEGVDDVFKTLMTQGKQVHIISGGIRQAILPMAEILQLPESNVHAVDVLFDAEGEYAGFDRQSVLAKTGGKAEICRQINHAQHKMVMIGDGKTDLEAKQAGADVIGFGGVVERAIVLDQADIFVKQASLTAVLPHL